MKRIINLMFISLAMLALNVSCGGGDDGGGGDTGAVTLEVTPATIKADGVEQATFKVKYDGQIVTGSAQLKMGGQAIAGMTFKTTTAGQYSFTAVYNGKTSNRVTVTATPGDPLVLSADKSTIVADDADEVVFTVMKDGVDVTADANICIKDASCLASNTFTTADADEYEFYATMKDDAGIRSNTLVITAQAIELTLSVDKTSIVADGVEEAVFTVLRNGVDVTDEANICIKGASCLVSNTFTTTDVEQYEFYATLKSGLGGESNTVTVNSKAVVLTLKADKLTMLADETDEVVFTVLKNGKEATDESNICIRGASCLLSNTFATADPGQYEFYATLKSGAGGESNALSVVAEEPFDSTRLLTKNVMYMIFTATWCGPCYTLKTTMKKVAADYGANMIQVNFYTNDSKAEVKNTVNSSIVADIKSDGRFSVSGYPSCFADLREKVAAEATIRNRQVLYTGNVAKTGIKVRSTVDNGMISATVTVGAKIAGDYSVNVLLVEDNVVAYQNGGGDSYSHMGVYRNKAYASMFGAALGTMAAGGEKSNTYNFIVPPSSNVNNLYLVAYTICEENGYKVISNTVKAPVQGRTEYSYKN